MELDKRGLDLHGVRCPLCDDDLETVDHSLIFCKHVIDVWDRVYKWWNMDSFFNYSIIEICGTPVSNTNSMSKFGKKIWQEVNWIGLYLIWKKQNAKVFRNKCWNTPVALNEIQAKMFEWISARAKGKSIDWLTWLSNPSIYLSLF
ncbi:uncharacterized protein [Rutidosis leptorrhynchoides]|uniref:uncharacterized protein n=1 Tax=Rutidosis leptorrhynchoides TaxID=125765 RepID=UPI003A990003